MKLIGNPARSTSLAERVSYTPGKTMLPSRCRIAPTRVWGIRAL
jgi:hypothetical protein